MNYCDFVEQVARKVQERAGGTARVDVNSILKTNLAPIDGLTILKEGENLAPAIWLNPYYYQYECGNTSVAAIAEEIVSYRTNSPYSGHFDLSFYTDFSCVRDRIACKLIHRGMNKKLLEEVPHRDFLDLAVVYYYKMEEDAFPNSSILVKNDHAAMWETTQKDLDAIALANTPRLLPADFKTLAEMISEVVEVESDLILQQEFPMYVLTNQEKNFGASMLLFPETLRMIYERLGQDYFVLPSSIHECIVIPAFPGILPEDLHEMVCEINAEHVAAEELLGDSIYRYNKKENALQIAYAKENRDA